MFLISQMKLLVFLVLSAQVQQYMTLGQQSVSCHKGVPVFMCVHDQTKHQIT